MITIYDYNPTYNFSTFQSQNPTTPLPANEVDSNLIEISSSLNQLAAVVNAAITSSGVLANATVGPQQLQAGVTLGVSPATAWATATAYLANATVIQSNLLYLCLVSHTSGTFATDLAANKWVLLDSLATASATASAAAASAQADLIAVSAILSQAVSFQDFWAGSSSGTNTITLTPATAITANTTGQRFRFFNTNSNTSPTVTVAVSGQTALPLLKAANASLVALGVNDLPANTICEIENIDGSHLQLINVRPFSQGANIASASTINLDTATGDYVLVTGTTGISAITLSQGRRCFTVFGGALTLTYGASLITPTGANLTVASGDVIEWAGEASGVVRAIAHLPAAGVAPLASPALTGTPTAPTASAGTNTTQLATTAYCLAAAANAARGFLNKFRNPALDIAQRGTSGTVTSGNSAYTVDGWIVAATGANVSWAQGSNGQGPTGSQLQLTGNAGMTQTGIVQRLESSVAAQLLGPYGSASAVTVQYAVYNNTGATITPQLVKAHANSQDNWGAATTDVTANLQSCPNGVVTICAYTFASIPTSDNNGIQLGLNFGAALNTNGKSVLIMGADIRSTPGVTVGLNSNPPVMEYRPIWAEMPFCGAYYETSYGNGVAPGTATQAGMVCGHSVATNITYKYPKRTSSSIAIYDAAGASGKCALFNSSGILGSNGNSPVTFPMTAGTTGFSAYLQTSTSTPAGIHFTASSEL